MGFGRIGRNLFRILYKRDDIRIGAITDLADPAGLEYLLRFDTVLGRTIPTKLIVQDHVYKDTSIVLLSDFQMLTNADPKMFVPDYLLALPDLTS